MEQRKISIAITHGDINGIGYEVILKALSNPMILDFCTPVIYGSAKAMAFHRKVLDLPPFNYNSANSAKEIQEGKVNLINCIAEEVRVDIGQSTPVAGEAALIALKAASDDLAQGAIDVLVTAPINKENIQSKEFEFPGHTEFLQERFAEQKKATMLMVQDNLRVAVFTGHIPLSEVSGKLNKTDLANKMKSLHQTLKRDFGINLPRIAVLGLNPHAGDGGVIGTEEKEIITPAIEMAVSQGVQCFGPYAADGFFGSGRHNQFDAVLAMYHDQGLIPFKTLAMDLGVNYTANLSIVRTSPAHGTAYDIAGKGIASESSFLQALYLAIDVYRNRLIFDQAKRNPLHKQFFEKGKDDVKLDLD